MVAADGGIESSNDLWQTRKIKANSDYWCPGMVYRYPLYWRVTSYVPFKVGKKDPNENDGLQPNLLLEVGLSKWKRS